jgi:hypothetical protein
MKIQLFSQPSCPGSPLAKPRLIFDHRRVIRAAAGLVAVAVGLASAAADTVSVVPQTFTWAVNSAATETWRTESIVSSHGSIAASTRGVYEETVTAGINGTASFSYRMDIWSFPGRSSFVDVRIDDTTTYPFRNIFLRMLSSSDATSYAQGDATFPVLGGHNYRFSVIVTSDISQNGRISWDVPQSVQSRTQTATRRGSAGGQGVVVPGSAESKIGGFSARPEPQQGGPLTGTSFTLSWNNPNVQLVFSDTRSRTTGNPNAAILATTLPPPSLTRSPESQTRTVGSSAEFIAGAVGAEPLTYEWVFRGQPIAGATGASWRVSPLTLDDAGEYAVRVTNPLGSILSSPASLTVASLPPPPSHPRIQSPVVANGRVFLIGTSGAPGVAFRVLACRVLDGSSQWTSVASGVFDPAGDFLVSAPVSDGAAIQFWRLEVP